MTVPAGLAKEQYAGSGSSGPFAFNHKVYAASHLTVVKTVAGVDDPLVLTTDYTVILTADFTSASITLVGVLAVGETLTAVLDPPIEQQIAYSDNDPFPAATHERALDLAIMIIGRLNEKIGRSLLLPESSTLSGLTLPDPDPLFFLRWNAAGDALENMDISSVGDLAVSPYILTLLDDVNAAAARATLGVIGTDAIRERLLANRTYFVRTDGNDGNTGLVDSAGGAYLTIQKAIDTAYNMLDLNTFTVTIQVRDGTFARAIVTAPAVGRGDIILQGNSGTPANVILTATAIGAGNGVVDVRNDAVLLVRDFAVNAATSGELFRAFNGGSIFFQNIRFGAAVQAQISADAGSYIEATGNYAITAGAAQHIFATNGSEVRVQSRTVTLTGTPAWTAAGVMADHSGIALVNGNTWSGSATGKRFQGDRLGIIHAAAGLTELPGNSAGTVATGSRHPSFTNAWVPVGQANGLTIVNNTATPTTQLDVVTTGRCVLEHTTTPVDTVCHAAASLTINAATTGVNALDTGALAASTVYNVWLISDGVTLAALLSLSASAPTMPTGYTFRYRVGAVRTGGASTFLRTIQKGNVVRYQVVTGSTTPNLPQMGTGASGSPTVPTWTSLAIGSFVVPTAVRIAGVFCFAASGVRHMLAPNNAYGVYNSTTNPPPVAGQSAGEENHFFDFVLESTNIFWASDAAQTKLMAAGWTDAVNAN